MRGKLDEVKRGVRRARAKDLPLRHGGCWRMGSNTQHTVSQRLRRQCLCASLADLPLEGPDTLSSQDYSHMSLCRVQSARYYRSILLTDTLWRIHPQPTNPSRNRPYPLQPSIGCRNPCLSPPHSPTRITEPRLGFRPLYHHYPQRVALAHLHYRQNSS